MHTPDTDVRALMYEVTGKIEAEGSKMGESPSREQVECWISDCFSRSYQRYSTKKKSLWTIGIWKCS
jgi:hypothetical protein